MYNKSPHESDKATSKPNVSVFYVSHECHITLKPAPCDTKCDEKKGRFSYTINCLREKMQKIDRIPLSQITPEEQFEEIGHLFHVKPVDLLDPVVAKAIMSQRTFSRDYLVSISLAKRTTATALI
jgi:hypothetical protein